MCTPSCSRAAAALALLALAACPRPREDAEVYAAKNAVVRYNQALVESYRAGRAELLVGVASEGEVSRVAALISGLATRGQYMEARQTAYAVTRAEVRPGGDGGRGGAVVDAEERWVYEHRSLGARDAPVPQKTLGYRLSYLLERRGDGWVVAQVLDQDHPPAGSGP